MNSLPLFHRVAGQPVIVLGEGEAAAAKRRLVDRAGGDVVTEIAQGVDRGARLAFVAHENPAACEADAIRLRCAGVLVNVVDRPELCDFTTPSLIDRDPVLVAVGTGGASAGLAKALRLRLDRLLPQGLGQLARALEAAREALRSRWPDARDRRAVLDAALDEGGALDPLAESQNVGRWLEETALPELRHEIVVLASPDADELTLRAARLLGRADALVLDGDIPPAILARARADAIRLRPGALLPEKGLVVTLRFDPD